MLKWWRRSERAERQKVAFGPPKVSAKRWAEIWADEDEIAVQEESKKQESKKK